MIRAFNKMDKPLLILSIFMFIFGLFMILDASSMKSFLNTGENTKYFFRQLIFLVSALVMAIIIIRKPLKKYNKLIFLIAGVLILMLIFLLVAGEETSAGVKSWIYIGPFGLQPSEFAKVALILFTGEIIRSLLIFRRQYRIVQFIIHGLRGNSPVIIFIRIEDLFHIPVFIIRIIIGIIIEVRTKTSVRGIDRLQMIEGSIIGEFQVFQVILKPDPSTVIIPFRAFHHSDFIRIEKIESITERFVSTFCHYGMFMADPQFPYRNGQPIHIISFLHQFQNPVICIQLIIRPSGFGRFFIQSGTHFVFQFFFCIHQIIIRKIGYFEVGTTVIRQLQFSGFGKYCLDHHNTIGST